MGEYNDLPHAGTIVVTHAMEATHRDDVWGAESYDRHASTYLPMAGALVAATDVGADDRVLDVGCGTGAVALSAARRGADVTGVDITPGMLEQARENATLAGLGDGPDGPSGADAVSGGAAGGSADTAAGTTLEWRHGDAADLPVEDDAFDATLSNLGHMYGAPQADVTEELLRVTRSGGRIGFTAWTPGGAFPALGAALLGYVSPADLPVDPTEPPFQWGDPSVVEERLVDATAELTVETRTLEYPVLSPAHFWAERATGSGLIGTAVADLDGAERAAVREDAVQAIEPFFDPDANVVELEYLHVTATVE